MTQPNSWKPPWPFILLNLSVLLVFWTCTSPIAVGVAVVLYFVRMFGITGVYHRYFSHRTYKTSRFMQFVLAFLGNTSGQRGPLWWAAHHRHHHAHSETAEDPHSPVQHGFWNSHVLWWGRAQNMPTRLHLIRDFAKYPELVFLDRFDSVAPVFLAVVTYLFGAGLHRWAPGLHTNGMQMLVWGFFISTAILFHGVATINSLAHVIGSRRFRTTDQNRNNFFLALLTMGEGWHNNHHHYPNSARQGFYWWEIDPSYYALRVLEWLGLVWDLKPVPERILEQGVISSHKKSPPIRGRLWKRFGKALQFRSQGYAALERVTVYAVKGVEVHRDIESLGNRRGPFRLFGVIHRTEYDVAANIIDEHFT